MASSIRSRWPAATCLGSSSQPSGRPRKNRLRVLRGRMSTALATPKRLGVAGTRHLETLPPGCVLTRTVASVTNPARWVVYGFVPPLGRERQEPHHWATGGEGRAHVRCRDGAGCCVHRDGGNGIGADAAP